VRNSMGHLLALRDKTYVAADEWSAQPCVPGVARVKYELHRKRFNAVPEPMRASGISIRSAPTMATRCPLWPTVV